MFEYKKSTTSKMPNLKKFINPPTPDSIPAPEQRPMGGLSSVMNQKVPLGQSGSGQQGLGQKQPLGQKSSSELKKPVENKPMVNKNTYSIPSVTKEIPGPFSQERLQEAIMWNEILGKPVSKRRWRRG